MKCLLENLTHTNEKLKGVFEILPCFVQITLLESTKNFVPQIHAIEVHSNAINRRCNSSYVIYHFAVGE